MRMNRYQKKLYWVFCTFLLVQVSLFAQVNCSQIDLNKVPGKWTWQQAGFGKQWILGESIRTELKRVFPKANAGLDVKFSIAFGGQNTFHHSASPAYYEYYLLLKKYECLRGSGKVQPEGETGAWVYMVANSLDGQSFPLPGVVGFDFYKYPSRILVTHIKIETDAAGNRIIYTKFRPGSYEMQGYYFSPKKEIPLRKLSRREVYMSYKLHHEKRLKEQIEKFEKLVRDDQKKYDGLTATEKKEQNYWPNIIRKNQEFLDAYKKDMNAVNAWFTKSLSRRDLDSDACVESVNPFFFLPEKLEAPAETGYPVWVDDPGFFDKTKPRDQAQCLTLYIRRQDSDLPKKEFMDCFYKDFNLNVLYRHTGAVPPKTVAANTLSASFGESKPLTRSQPRSRILPITDFRQSVSGTFPPGWEGPAGVSIREFEKESWLALTQDGEWNPRQYNQEIRDSFTLSFQVRWNADISYNSGLLQICFSDLAYDQAQEKYMPFTNNPSDWGNYPGYGQSYSRVFIWFDPWWNGGGTITVYSYNKAGFLQFDKRITLPDFFREKNDHRLRISRKGNGLVVTDNGKLIADLPAVFLPSARYNFFTLGRYKGEFSDNKADVFLLRGMEVNY